MAKIDLSKILGYDSMTPEEKIAALEAFEVSDPKSDADLEKLKQIAEKAKKDAEEARKQLRSRQTAEEVAAAEKEAKFKELQEKYDALSQQETIRGYTEKYKKMGYDDELAQDTAKAFVNGDYEKVFANGEKAHAAREQELQASRTRGTPRPTDGNGGTTYKTKAEIMAITDTTERQKAISENLELFSSEEN